MIRPSFFIVFPLAVCAGLVDTVLAQAPNRSGGLLAPPSLNSRKAIERTVPAATRMNDPAPDNRVADNAGGHGSLTPVVPRATIPAERTGDQPVTRVTKGTGVLPNDHGQVWREYDISPYTSRVTTTERPEQAIIDWILRETGTEVWFSEPLGILSTDKNTLRVYHTPEMQQTVAQVVDRFVASQAESQMLGLRLVTIGNPNWRAKAFPFMKQVSVQTPGIDAWLVSKENTAFLLAELGKRTDFREHNSPNLAIHNGQSQTVARLRPKPYIKSIRPNGTQPGAAENESVTFEEGYSLQISPLFSLDGKVVDAVVKCHIDQVERLVAVNLDNPLATSQMPRGQIQVPQIVSWRLHERFRWPTDQVLLLSCGVVATPAPEARTAMNIVNSLTTTNGRADALLFIECQGRANPNSSVPRDDTRSATRLPTYRGRY